MYNIFFYDGVRQCGSAYVTEVNSINPVAEGLKATGWKVVVTLNTVDQATPWPGYEEAHAEYLKVNK